MTSKTNHKAMPTISDVARHAGVSTATVSRVLNKSDSATSESSQRVLSAVRELGYRPQRHRGKAETKNTAVYILTENLNDPFYLEVISGIQDEAESQNLIPVIILGAKQKQVTEILERLKSQPGRGIISAGVYMSQEEWNEYQEQANVPIVVLNNPIRHERIAAVLTDFGTSAAQAIHHLISLNHTRIAFMGDYDDAFAKAQFDGVKHALRSSGLDYPDEYRFSVPHTLEGATQGISKMVALPEDMRPTALFACDDVMAIYILNAVRYYGLRIPEDISLIGFDNIQMAAHSNPPLTTVEIPKRRIGRLMLNLINELRKNEYPGDTIIQGSVIVRGTTGRARA